MARALDWQSKGQGFESPTLHIHHEMYKNPYLSADFHNKIAEILHNLNAPSYRLKQILNWIFVKRIWRWSQMTDLPESIRNALEQNYPTKPLEPIDCVISSDHTKKYLFHFPLTGMAETVYLPEQTRHTLCISTQSGCSLGCLFCRTSSMKPAVNLSVEQLLAQLLFIKESQTITNIVLMGMGEPLLNWENVKQFLFLLTDKNCFGFSKRKVTLSTVGIAEPLIEFMVLEPCRLAISLHTPFHDERKKLMPIENTYPIKEIIHILRKHKNRLKIPVSIEYIIFSGLNNTPAHAREIARLLNGLNVKINLIPYNEINTAEFKTASLSEIVQFQNTLMQKGFRTTIRKSRGADIHAACGMLAAQARKPQI